METRPALINQSCYENGKICFIFLQFYNFVNLIIYFVGWLFKLELSSMEEISKLMNEEQYAEFIKQDHS